MLTRPVALRRRIPRSSRSGFALLITITLVAFLVLILVGLATFTRVETQVATNSQDLAQARQNALMALNIALGELQKTAGPDQRTTAPATLGEAATAVTAAGSTDNGLVTPADGTRFWTGVWGNKSAPEAVFTSPPQPVLLRWLVSGNENSSTITVGGDGRISAPTSAATTPFTPSHLVTQANGAALSIATIPTTPLLINNLPATLLLGANTAGDDPGSYVVAPLVDISTDQIPGLSGPVRMGRYAWWVGDEGVKAKYNLPDPYIANSTPDDDASNGSRDSRYRVLAAQRHGIEQMTAFAGANYPLASTAPADALYLGVGHTITASGVRLAAPAIVSAELKKHAHDLTTHSYGVLADSQFGGLRRDLTFHLDPQSGDTFLDGRNIIPDGVTPASSYSGSKYTARPSLFSETTANGGLGLSTLNVSPRLGPKWDQLKSFYRMAYDHPGDLEVQPAVDIDVNPVKVQAAITPVILEVRTLFALKAGPAIDTSIIVILGNPYTRPLKASSGLNLRMAMHPNVYDNSKQHSQEWGLITNYIGEPSPTDPTMREMASVFTRLQGGLVVPTDPMQQAPLKSFADPTNRFYRHYYPILKFAVPPGGDGPSDPDAAHPGLLDNVLFQIPPGVLDLAPGEAKAYKLDPSASLPDEVVNGMTMQVKALQEMAESFATYFTTACDPRYINDSAQLPPGLLNGAPLASGHFFRIGLTRPSEGGLDFTLTLPGKPKSVLQSLGPVGLPGDTQTGGLPAHDRSFNVFGSTREPITGARQFRVFGNGVGDTYAGESVRVTQAEASLIGGFQPIYRYDATNVGGRRSILRTSYNRRDDTNFTTALDTENAVQAAWGRGYAGDPLRFSPQGKFALHDVPSALQSDEVPILSLAQLQHADLTADDEALGTATQPGNVLGNSLYERFVPRSDSRSAPVSNHRSLRFSNQSDSSSTALGDSPKWYDGYVRDLPKTTNVRFYDMSYLLNAALWDGTFFSTVRPAAGSDTTLSPQPANRRLVYVGSEHPTLGQLRGTDTSVAIQNPAALAPDEIGRVPAAHMLNNGAFNVNSTSVEAWIALLSGLRGLGVNGASATAAPDALTPFARSIRQPGGVQSVLPAATTVKATEDTYTGFRALTDSQVATLAAEIVNQVKARGPFLSLAQFVNRHLTSAAPPGNPVGDTSLEGALRQAIKHAGLNDNLNNASALARATTAREAGYPDNTQMPEGNTSGLSTYMGVPGWLSQADMLQAIAPSLAARSDTFVIRTYGEVVDPVNSPAAPAAPVVKGRAWCEAVVQRLPDYVDASQRPTVSQANANPENQAFGRRFRIVSFRWLSSDDI